MCHFLPLVSPWCSPLTPFHGHTQALKRYLPPQSTLPAPLDHQAMSKRCSNHHLQTRALRPPAHLLCVPSVCTPHLCPRHRVGLQSLIPTLVRELLPSSIPGLQEQPLQHLNLPRQSLFVSHASVAPVTLLNTAWPPASDRASAIRFISHSPCGLHPSPLSLSTQRELSRVPLGRRCLLFTHLWQLPFASGVRRSPLTSSY